MQQNYSTVLVVFRLELHLAVRFNRIIHSQQARPLTVSCLAGESWKKRRRRAREISKKSSPYQNASEREEMLF